jgi:hypothetical protein
VPFVELALDGGTAPIEADHRQEGLAKPLAKLARGQQKAPAWAGAFCVPQARLGSGYDAKPHPSS